MIDKHDQQDKHDLAQRRPVHPARQGQAAHVAAETPAPAAMSAMRAPADILRNADVASLQQTVGNQVVQRLLDQRKSDMIQRKGDDPNVVSANLNELAKYTPNFGAPRSQAAPASFKVTVAVSQKVPEYLVFAKSRMKSTIRNKIREGVRAIPGGGALIRKPKSGAAIKEKAARRAVEKTTGVQATLQDPAVQNIINNSESVGHSWIKLSTVGADGSLIQTYSFGFLPNDPSVPHGPQQAVPGRVRNPDLEFESYADHTSRFLDSDVKASAYRSALQRIAGLQAAPPAYMTIGYNCTQFTKDIAKAAGATFPSKAGMMIPISDRGVMKRALSPNALYGKLGNDADTKDKSEEQTLMQEQGYVQGDTGLRLPVAQRPADKRLMLIDMMKDEDDPNASFKIELDEVVIPTGITMGTSMQVEYKGQFYYAEPNALNDHLAQQTPETKSIHTLRGSLKATSATGANKTIPAGTKVRVHTADDDEVTVETSGRDMFLGTTDHLSFWKAVAGI